MFKSAGSLSNGLTNKFIYASSRNASEDMSPGKLWEWARKGRRLKRNKTNYLLKLQLFTHTFLRISTPLTYSFVQNRYENGNRNMQKSVYEELQ